MSFAEYEENTYDQFKVMMGEIRRFGDKYKSFTTNKTYQNLLGQTATGLIKDAAARTEKLTSEEIKKHLYAQELFAAFVMYFCVDKIRKQPKTFDKTLAGDTVSSVYQRILTRVRKDLETTGESLYVRNLIKNSADHEMKSLLGKDALGGIRQIPKEDKPIVKSGFKEIEKPDKNGKIPDKFSKIVATGAWGDLLRYYKYKALEKALVAAVRSKEISQKELDVLCYSFGLGDGYCKEDGNRYSNNEIAGIFNISASAISQSRKKALKKLFNFINSSEWRDALQ